MENDYIKEQFLNYLSTLEQKAKEHEIMKRIIQENGLWETLLNDKEFIEYLDSYEE